TKAYVFRGDGRLGGEEVIVWGGVTRHSSTGTAKAVVTVQPIYRTSTGWGATGSKRVIELRPRGGDWGRTPLDEIAWALREYVSQMGFKGPLAAPQSVA